MEHRSLVRGCISVYTYICINAHVSSCNLRFRNDRTYNVYIISQFAEQMSLNHISPWFNGDNDPEELQSGSLSDCKVWRNAMNLFRGSEYQRFYWASGKEPLTYYDMNLSAQDHQTFFTCESDAGKAEYELMQTAWRERNPVARIKVAHDALKINVDCAPAYILLAEEEALTIADAEKILKQALKVAEANYRLVRVGTL